MKGNYILQLKLIIRRMVQNAKNYLNRGIKKIVITVPIYFTEEQRHSMKDAANIAGLEFLAIISFQMLRN